MKYKYGTDIKKIFKYYNHHIKKYNKLFVLTVLCSIVSKVLSIIPAYFNGKIIDHVIALEFNQIIHLLLLSFSVFLINSVISLIETYNRIYLSNKITFEIKTKIFNRITYLKVNEFNKKTLGEFMSIMDGDTSAVSSFYMNGIITAITGCISLIISFLFIVKISISLSVIGLISFPFSILINHIYGKKLRRLQGEIRKRQDNHMSFIQEYLSGFLEIKNLVKEKLFIKKNRQNLEALFESNMKSGITSSFGGLIQMTVSMLMQLILIAFSCYKMVKGTLTVGYYMIFQNFLNQFLTSLQTITSLSINIQTVLVSMERIDGIMEYSDTETLDGRDMYKDICGKIILEDLCFSYDNGKEVIKNLNVTFFPKEAVVLVGLSGCGKSTLLNLLMGYYEPTGGAIWYDSKNIKEFHLNELREQITYVQQEPFLFHDTIKNNLKLAHPEATEEELVNACKKAYIYEDILKMDNGFDFIIGERGSRLSGGQKQRLAIARGILKNSTIFLLDEITSDVDSEAEQHLIKAVSDLSKEHTIIMIAHRLSTITQMKKIIVLDYEGNVYEGTHRELLRTCNVYQQLFQENAKNNSI